MQIVITNKLCCVEGVGFAKIVFMVDGAKKVLGIGSNSVTGVRMLKRDKKKLK